MPFCQYRAIPPILLILTLLAAPSEVRAAPDEIQVYCDDLNRPGESELEVHTNFVGSGRSKREYDRERPPYQILRITPEYSIGLTEHWDVGFYLPTAYDANHRAGSIDGAKFRIKYLRAGDWKDGSLFYGLNTEIGYSERRIEEVRWNSEFRGIMGLRRGGWLVVLNPVLNLAWVKGSTAELETQFKLGREVGRSFSIGLEHYAGFGPVGRFDSRRNQEQNTYAVLEYDGGSWEINVGIGRGWTPASDQSVAKAIFTFPFDRKP